MIFTFLEIVYLVILTFSIGYIFSGFFIRRPRTGDILDQYKKRNRWFDWESMKFAILVTAPAVVLHELGHKFVAMAYGLSATFKIWSVGLGIGIILRLVGSPFILVAPGYVAITQGATASQMGWIAFAGPAVNLVMWIGSWLLLKFRTFDRNWTIGLNITSRINMILFFFNMIPFGPLDGAKILNAFIGT